MRVHPPLVFLVGFLIAFVALAAQIAPVFARIAEVSTP